MAMGQNKKAKEGQAPNVEDRSRMIMDVAPGRKGCTSVFPWGGSIKVPPGLFGKKDNLIAKMISPCERHMHAPTLRDTEKLLSEVFLFVARNYEFDKLLTVEFPVYEENLDLFEMRLKVKKSGDQDWITLEDYTYNAKTKMITFETKSLGVFVVTSTPKAEKFELTQNGCLYSARINRYILLRFPKRAVDRTLKCEIMIHKVTQEKIEITQRDHGNECNDVVTASNFYDITFPENEATTFRRAASIKLPLTFIADEEPSANHKQENENEQDGDHDEADMEVEKDTTKHIDLDNLHILHKTEEEGWTIVETPMKFTRTTVQFDVKCLGKFILVQTKPGLPKHRLKFAMPFIEEQNLKIKGEILTFLYKEKKHWRMMFDVVDKEYADIITLERKEAGWSFIDKLDIAEKVVEENQPGRGRGRRAQKEQKKEDPELKALNLHNGSTYTLTVNGDFKLAESTPGDRLVLQYHEKLTDNYTYFDVVPVPPQGWHWDKDKNKNKTNGVIEKQNGEVNEKETNDNKENIENGLENGVSETARNFTGVISCCTKEPDNKRLLRKYNAVFSEEDFVEFIKPEYVEPEPEPERPKTPAMVIVNQEMLPSPKQQVKYKNFNTPQFSRLTRPTRPVIRISREAKVLSGRSLQILSREVEQGLTLAVHLNLPDSTITGIGFDSLSNGMSLVDVTYKVLLHWKRLYKGDKEKQVEQLVLALKEMGRFDVAAVVMDRHRQGVELSSDCFKY